MMALTRRLYQGEDDYWRIRTFLREVLLRNDLRELSWHVAEFDYWRWHLVANLSGGDLADGVFLWETAEGRLAAVLNPIMGGEAILHVHPDFRTPALEDEMLTVAAEHLAVTGDDGRRTLWVSAGVADELRRAALTRNGFECLSAPERQAYWRRRPLDAPIPASPPPLGYTVRALGDGLELLERCYASGLAFHPDEPAIAIENRDDVSWYRNIQNAPLYRRDLDLVAVAPDGAVAAFCTAWFDDVTRTAVFEPVGTVPAHQRRGLGKAVLCEAFRRLKRLGAVMAYVHSYEAPAHALYASVGFTDYDLVEPFFKSILR
ncbi:MAG TPA: GNAT family N-acetyltransferase [Anaerolineae bacterium]|nr:GNAT family N-acetyltransferase [Anaerolineae bacterium]